MDIWQLGNPTTWDWLSLIKTAFGAGLGTAAVQGGISLYRERSLKTDHASYLALRIAVLLEAYASDCCDFYFDNANAQQPPDEPYPAWRTVLPKVPTFPDDTEAWRAMDRSLVARCLNFGNRVRGSQNTIAGAIEYTPDTLDCVLDEQVCARGVEAWDIASALRRTYNIDDAEIGFDYRDTLSKVLQQTRETISKRDAAQAQFLAELSARENTSQIDQNTDT